MRKHLIFLVALFCGLSANLLSAAPNSGGPSKGMIPGKVDEPLRVFIVGDVGFRNTDKTKNYRSVDAFVKSEECVGMRVDLDFCSKMDAEDFHKLSQWRAGQIIGLRFIGGIHKGGRDRFIQFLEEHPGPYAVKFLEIPKRFLRNLSEDQVTAFAAALTHFQGLEDLDLNFSQRPQHMASEDPMSILIPSIIQLTQLKSLIVNRDTLSAEAIETLETFLPGCKICN